MKREKAFTAKLARALWDLQLAPDRQTAIDLARKACKCGARTKKGTPCQRSGILPSLRCIKHGGQHFHWITEEGREAMRKASRERHERRRTLEAEEAKLRAAAE